jgi:phage terminase large subunit
MDCNPDAPEHWLNKRCAGGFVTRIKTTHRDNPSITPEYMTFLDSLTGYRRKRLRDGQWVAAEGQYFYEWDPDRHICKPFDIPATWTRWLAVDYGFADPWCVLWFARNPADKRHVYIYREAYATGLRDEQQAEQIVKASGNERISIPVGDPSMFNKRTEQSKPSIAWVYWQKGVPLRPAYNDRIAGWQTVRRALAWDDEHKPRLQIMDGRAPNLVRTLPSMVHDPLDSEDLADKIKSVKTEDHPADCIRYGLVLEAMPDQQQAKLVNFRVEAA